MSATPTTTKLPPVTITIADQQVLRRLHKVAGRYYNTPHQMAKVSFNVGLWECVRGAKEVDATKG